jgi:hypothetical protein
MDVHGQGIEGVPVARDLPSGQVHDAFAAFGELHDQLRVAHIGFMKPEARMAQAAFCSGCTRCARCKRTDTMAPVSRSGNIRRTPSRNISRSSPSDRDSNGSPAGTYLGK